MDGGKTFDTNCSNGGDVGVFFMAGAFGESWSGNDDRLCCIQAAFVYDAEAGC